ncbi:hypothetical protein BRADI_1g45342v3 [Brachypodium distachyon]|uniref:Uncharacterized protein n=1 Tax=Brachypodium distachyon TaxID=15368 RepID=A0A2K2DPG9_BRADI|nr:hypothetical protein BRADI_1g45342v3 [Brachypodium distachyon]PNT76175.1 hypothetical protein BRADI_1g45342v3 [Brachypodium distachyon]
MCSLWLQPWRREERGLRGELGSCGREVLMSTGLPGYQGYELVGIRWVLGWYPPQWCSLKKTKGAKREKILDCKLHS